MNISIPRLQDSGQRSLWHDKTIHNPATLESESRSQVDRCKQSYHCDQCSFIATTRRILLCHMQNQHHNAYQCPESDKYFPRQKTIHQHMKAVHDSSWQKMWCNKCYRKFSSVDSLKSHLCLISDNVCDVCMKRCKSVTDWKRHIIERHGIKPFRCVICPKRFKSYDHVNTHMRVHTGEKPYVCKVCKNRYSQSSQLSMHNRIHVGHRQHACKYCKKRFVHRHELKLHVDGVHKKTRRFKCKYCDSRFSQAANMRTHMKYHTGVGLHHCEVCGKKYVSANALRIHMGSHEKQYQCKDCDKCFGNEYHLKAHYKRLHSAVAVKRHVCLDCGKSYTDMNNLRRHQRFHGDKNFECADCFERFHDPSALKHHIINWHSGRHYNCSQCGAAFDKPYKLEFHRRTVCRKIFDKVTCELCNVEFTSVEHLKAHVNYIHQ